MLQISIYSFGYIENILFSLTWIPGHIIGFSIYFLMITIHHYASPLTIFDEIIGLYNSYLVNSYIVETINISNEELCDKMKKIVVVNRIKPD